MFGYRSTRGLFNSTKQQVRNATSTPSNAPKRPTGFTPRPRTNTFARSATATSPAPTTQNASPSTFEPSVGTSTVASTSSPTAVSSSSPAPTSELSSTSDPLSFDSYSATPSSSSSIAQDGSTKHAEIDWQTSFHGMSASPFTERQADILMRPLEASEVEIKPDGLLYLPEILYRRILNKAFGPGGWGMVPRGEMTIMKGMVTREWGLIAGGRLVSVARGEQTFFDPSGMPTASEGCKSNALMRCCKDLGIASELWDPSFIRMYKAQHCVEAWTEHVVSKRKQKRWRKKGNKFDYPYNESKM